jgi:hypothetical protein
MVALFTSCNQGSKAQDESPEVKYIDRKNEQENDWEQTIQLNNGSKWQANEATTEGILAMESIIAEANPITVKDFQQLGTELNEENMDLIKKCSMEGPSHDNLHIYLKPLIQKIAALQETPSAEEGNMLTSEIEKHLKAYLNYFI